MESKTPTRIYIVEGRSRADMPRFVRAYARTQAIRHVARDTITARIPTSDELLEAGRAGIQVENASDDHDHDDQAPEDGGVSAAAGMATAGNSEEEAA